MQRFDGLVDEPYSILEEKPVKPKGISTRKFKHTPAFQRQGGRVPKASLAAASINQLQSVLTRDQLLQCANAYTNNGIVRTVIDKSVFFIQGERSGFLIEPNEELTEGATDQEIRKIEESIRNDAEMKRLRRNTLRLNKRVKLHDRVDKLLTSTHIFGRNALEIIRLPPGETDSGSWNTFGEPYALRHLNSLRITDVQMDSKSGVFQGFYYDEGNNTGDPRLIKSQNLIPAFYDDNNLYDNTNCSGLSPLWPILSVSQADDVINDEDIPEAVKNLAGALTTIYAGTNNQSKIDQLTEVLSDKRIIVHGLEGMKTESYSMAGNILQLPDVRLANAKYMCMCMSLPLFLLFEDTANFATANQVMQVFKAGWLKRQRTWLQGILEDYWYDTILADHLGIELKDVIGADIKIKAIFPDINFETRKDIVEADKILVDIGTFNAADVAKDIDRKDIVQRIEEEQAAEDQQRQEAINNTLVAQKNQITQLQQQSQLSKQQQQLAQQQQASAAASIRAKKKEKNEKDEEVRLKRLSLMEDMRKKLNAINTSNQ
jgi:hypothetical protein